MEYRSGSGSFLNEARLLSGGAAETACGGLAGAGLSCGSFRLSSGAGLSAFVAPGGASSVHSLCLLERLVSRGGVLLAGGRRYTAAAVLAVCVGAAAAPAAWGADAEGRIDVGNGQTSSGVTLEQNKEYRYMHVSDGGVANSTTINVRGMQYVSDGGVASSTTINARGVQYVSDGGVANSTTINERGEQHVYDGGMASSTTIADWGEQYVSDGGVASTTTINDGGRQYVYAGGSSLNAIQRQGGNINIEIGTSGALASTLVSGSNTDAGASFQLSGGTASGFILYSGGEQRVSEGGVASSTTINAKGWQDVKDGGVASFTTINDGGWQYVSAGGSSLNAIQHQGGNINVSVGTSGALASTLVSGSNTDASASFQLSGGIASGFILYSGGWQFVSEGGVASSTTISDGGWQGVFGGGVACSATINEGGVQNVSDDGVASSTTINDGGRQDVKDGGVAGSTTISGGVQVVYDGGKADNTSIFAGEQLVSNGGKTISTTISGGKQTLSGSASVTILAASGSQNVNDGGTATATTISAGARQNVRNGGKAGLTTISGGSQVVYDGGKADNTSIFGGGQIVSNGGLATSTIISGGSQVVSDGGKTDNTSMFGGGQIVSNGGLATSTTIAGGSQTLFGAASSTILAASGIQNVNSGGTAVDTTISAGGLLHVHAGGSATAAIQREGGDIQVDVGVSGALQFTSIAGSNADARTSFELRDGKASGFILYSGSILNVCSGGTATSTAVSAGGWQGVSDGGTASATSVCLGGTFFIDSGGSAFAMAGPVSGMLAGYGAVDGDVNIAAGGTLAPANSYLGSGADYGKLTVTGDLTIASGGVYQVRVNPADPAADQVAVAGTISVSGATLRHVAESGAIGSAFVNGGWLVMSGGSGVTGQFAQAETTLTLYKAVLDYDRPNEVWLGFKRSKTFLDDAQTPNQESVGQGLTSLEAINPGSDLIQAALATDREIPALYNLLSGEGYGTILSGIRNVDKAFAKDILHTAFRKRMAQIIAASASGSPAAFASINPRAQESLFTNNFWVDAGYSRQSMTGDGNVGRSTFKGPEVSLGYDQISPAGWLGGIVLRYGDRGMDIASRLTEADLDSYSIGLYGGFQAAFGPGVARLALGGAYSRHQIHSKRVVDFGTSLQKLEAEYHADSCQIFMEGAYAIPLGRVWIEPFADLSWASVRASGFAEKGGSAALYAPAYSHNDMSHLLGLRLVLPALFRVNVEAQAGWRHTYGKLNPAYSLGFVEGGDTFGIQGGRVNRDEAVLDLRADYALRENLHIGLEGNAALGERGTSVRGGAFIALEW